MMPSKVEISILLAGATALSYWIWRCKKREKVYVKVGKVKNLYFFPVKSLKGIEVPELECTHVGVKYFDVLDRSFMLISDDGVLISQRQEPRLTLLLVSMTEDHISITNLDGNTLKLVPKDIFNETKVVRSCRLHQTSVNAIDCGDAASEFFQDFLGRKDVRLVRFAPECSPRRYLGSNPIFQKLEEGKPFTLQDLSPLNIASQSSLDDLNTRLEEKVSILNFRPNVLVEDAPAFDEDNWEHVKFSSGAIVDVLFPCGRCILTTNDPETGIKTDKDPLQTLRKFRQSNNETIHKALNCAPVFAINCWLQKGGTISVGDEVFAVIKKGLFACKK